MPQSGEYAHCTLSCEIQRKSKIDMGGKGVRETRMQNGDGGKRKFNRGKESVFGRERKGGREERSLDTVVPTPDSIRLSLGCGCKHKVRVQKQYTTEGRGGDALPLQRVHQRTGGEPRERHRRSCWIKDARFDSEIQ